MSGLEHFSALLRLRSDGVGGLTTQSSLKVTLEKLVQIMSSVCLCVCGGRPSGPAQPSALPVCLWVLGMGLEVLEVGADCAVVWDEALDRHQHWVTLEGPWESAGHLQQRS